MSFVLALLLSPLFSFIVSGSLCTWAVRRKEEGNRQKAKGERQKSLILLVLKHLARLRLMSEGITPER